MLDRVVEFALDRLGLDVAYVAELKAGSLVYRAVAGDAASFNIILDDERKAAGTYSLRLAEGELPGVIADAFMDVRFADLPHTWELGIGTYVGVPLRLSDGTPYGALCCLGHEPRERIDEQDVRLLSMLAGLIASDLDDLRERDELHRQLLELIEHERFAVAYQPMFDLRSGRCLGIEALARFPEPFTRPERAFAAAATVGLDFELERLVIRQAWQVLPRLAAGQFLALNVSPGALLELARRAHDDHNLRLAQVVVEVTEHAAVEAYAALRAELTPLRQRGLRIAVDDAGNGYASLRHVLEMRPDFIKLDRWLIHGIADDSSRRVAVSAFVAIARELGSTVVAEGVERPEDLSAVGKLGLDAAQGYLLGRPTIDQDAVSVWVAHAAGHPLASSEDREVAVSSRGDDELRRSPATLLGGRETGASGSPGAARAREQPHAAVVSAAERRGAEKAVVAEELARLELDRRVSQRLEVVGQLAAGIAHEINTPLQFVGDSVTFLKDAVDELVTLTGLYRETLYGDAPIPVQERQQAMREAEDRADVEYLCERIPAAFARTADGIARVRSIVQAMKRFSHASSSDAEPADINEALETTLVVCRNEYKYVAEIVLELGELPAVTCNVGELNQVFLNLIMNAAQAIEEKVGDSGEQGQIRVSTRLEEATAVIEVADDGPGIPPALLDRIYEPFFTTKEVGKGTGQGLALARATIERHAGSLVCSSALGEGTTFTIRLPVQRASGELATAA